MKMSEKRAMQDPSNMRAVATWVERTTRREIHS